MVGAPGIEGAGAEAGGTFIWTRATLDGNGAGPLWKAVVLGGSGAAACGIAGAGAGRQAVAGMLGFGSGAGVCLKFNVAPVAGVGMVIEGPLTDVAAARSSRNAEKSVWSSAEAVLVAKGASKPKTSWSSPAKRLGGKNPIRTRLTSISKRARLCRSSSNAAPRESTCALMSGSSIAA